MVRLENVVKIQLLTIFGVFMMVDKEIVTRKVEGVQIYQLIGIDNKNLMYFNRMTYFLKRISHFFQVYYRLRFFKITQITTGAPIRAVTALIGNTFEDIGSWEMLSQIKSKIAPASATAGIRI